MSDTNTNAELPQLLQAAMRDMNNRVQAWWKRDGLGHASEVRLTSGGSLEVELSCSIYSELVERVYDQDPTLPEPERQARVLQQFDARGFLTLAEPGGDPAVRDCDTSRTTVQQLIKSTFPSAIVRNIDTRCTRSGAFVLASVTVFICDLAEVLRLPVPTPEA